MPWIQNTSMSDVKRGTHRNPGTNAMLIQICDPPGDFPQPHHTFVEVHQFQFLDVERDTEVLDDAMRCSQAQADELVRLLQHALANDMDVVVHCHAGVCRSGAVCEVGVMMGFQDTYVFRAPNLLVKHGMMRTLGMLYSDDEPHTINGVAIDPDWTNDNEKVFALASARRQRRLNGDE
jgi:rhodanese-related sulfurtransferase